MAKNAKENHASPTEVRLGVRRIPIHFPLSGTGAPGSDAWGTFNGVAIEVVRDVDAGSLLSTFLHELTHAILREGGVRHFLSKVDEMPNGGAGRIEESICDSVSAGLAQVWVDNPTLVTWLSALANQVRKER